MLSEESCLFIGTNSTNKKFALNSGIKYCQADNFFEIGNNTNDDEELPPCATAELPDNKDHREKTVLLIETILDSDHTSIFVLIGYPQSGKSRLTMKIQKKFPEVAVLSGKTAVNDFDLENCFLLMQKRCKIIIDARNPDLESRKKIVQMAQQFKYEYVVAIFFDVSKKLAKVKESKENK